MVRGRYNPPIQEDEEECYPCVSEELVLVDEGVIVVEDYRSGQYYFFDKCLGDSIENAVHAIAKFE